MTVNDLRTLAAKVADLIGLSIIDKLVNVQHNDSGGGMWRYNKIYVTHRVEYAYPTSDEEVARLFVMTTDKSYINELYAEFGLTPTSYHVQSIGRLHPTKFYQIDYDIEV